MGPGKSTILHGYPEIVNKSCFMLFVEKKTIYLRLCRKFNTVRRPTTDIVLVIVVCRYRKPYGLIIQFDLLCLSQEVSDRTDLNWVSALPGDLVISVIVPGKIAGTNYFVKYLQRQWDIPECPYRSF